MLAIADLLDGFCYAKHDPRLDLELSRRWEHYQQLLGLPEPLFRPPGVESTNYAVGPQSCPYSIAAYLRLWAALLDNPLVAGFYPTDKPASPWNYAGLGPEDAPHFFVAVRNGTLKPQSEDLAKHGVLAMERSLDPRRPILRTLWGTRGYGGSYYGDEYVDYYFHKTQPVPSLKGATSWRQRGHPGLLLYHVVKDPASGADLVTVGLGVPHGGPDHIAALKA